MQGRVRTLTTFKTGDPIQDRFQEHVKQTLQPVIDNPLLNAVDFRFAELQGADPSKTPTLVLQYRSTGSTWTTVFTCDSTGQIAQPAWTGPALLNSWAQAAGFLAIGYFKDSNGIVRLRGTVTNTPGTAANANLFVLPTGYRPSVIATQGGSDITAAAGAYRRFNIDSAGQVYPTAIVAAGTTVSLDNISFDTRS